MSSTVSNIRVERRKECISLDEVKLAERLHQVTTQLVLTSTMRESIATNGKGSQTIENILLKTNVKLGGLNYAIGSSNQEPVQKLKNENKFREDRLAKRLSKLDLR